MNLHLRLKLAPVALAASLFIVFAFDRAVGAAPLPMVKDVEWQPLTAQVKRLTEAMDYLGSPLSAKEKKALEAALDGKDTAISSEKVQSVLDEHCLFGVQINPEMRVKVAQGPAKPELMEQ